MSENIKKSKRKPVPWAKIKKEYLEGVTPRELALKYKIKARKISDKAYEDKWKTEKKKISENIRENTEDRINNLTNKAFDALEQVLDDKEAEYKDKVAAAKAIIDVSGLKKDKKELTGDLNVQKVFVTPEMHQATLEHINQVINDQ